MIDDHEQTNCKSLLESISDYLDGNLTGELCKELENHIAGCNNCRIVVDTLQKTITLYQTTRSENDGIPPGVQEHLFHILHMDDFHNR